MSPYDVTPDDEPLNAGAVGHDDLLIEQLRHALSPDAAVVWDDDDDETDPAFALLRALQLDVSANLPIGETLLPVGVTSLLPRRRHLSRTTTVAAVAAAVLSIGGVAAASAPGQPLAGVRHAVSDAVSHAVSAITPDSPVGPTVGVTKSPSAKPTPPGASVSAAARSASAIPQVEANLARAAAFLDAGKSSQAKQQLLAAARKLALVTDPVAKARLEARLTALQSRLAAMPSAEPTHEPGDNKGRGNEGESGKGNDDGNNAGGNSGKNRDSSGTSSDDGTTSGKNRPDAVRTPDATETADSGSGKSGRAATKAPSADLSSDGDSSGHGGSD